MLCQYVSFNVDSRGPGLLIYPGHDFVGRSASSVLHASFVSVFEKFQSGIAADLELLREVTVNGGVYLDQFHILVRLELAGRFSVLRRQGLAVATPRGI